MFVAHSPVAGPEEQLSSNVISYEPSCWPIRRDINCASFYGSGTSRAMEFSGRMTGVPVEVTSDCSDGNY